MNSTLALIINIPTLFLLYILSDNSDFNDLTLLWIFIYTKKLYKQKANIGKIEEVTYALNI